MKPVAIFRHSPTEGPGFFAAYLDAHRIPWQLIRIDEGEAVPDAAQPFSGLCFMGGPMSVNDDLPWIPEVLALIRDAVAHDVPCIGHCLGGQLMAKALGATVKRNPVKEIGWGTVQTAGGAAQTWLGDVGEFLSFHWHGETFDIPSGATRILGSAYCDNQAFVYGDKHLGMQCHVEMTPEMIRTWCRDWGNEVRNRAGASTQTPEQIEADLDARVQTLNGMAARIYDRWTLNLKR